MVCCDVTCDKSWEFGDCRLSESEVSVCFGPGFIDSATKVFYQWDRSSSCPYKYV